MENFLLRVELVFLILVVLGPVSHLLALDLRYFLRQLILNLVLYKLYLIFDLIFNLLLEILRLFNFIVLLID